MKYLYLAACGLTGLYLFNIGHTIVTKEFWILSALNFLCIVLGWSTMKEMELAKVKVDSDTRPNL